MRCALIAACLASACLLSLACGGTFCDEYPEACGEVGGGTPAPFDVEVSLLDSTGEVLPGVLVLVSDLTGKMVEQQFTGPDGLTVSVSGDSYVSVFNTNTEGDAHAFTALATRDAPKLTFRLPVGAASNPPTNIQVTATCGGNCLPATELSVSCRAPLEMSTMTTDAHGLLSDYVGCASSPDYDAYIVGYDNTGLANKASTKPAALTSETLGMPNMASLDSEDRFQFEMKLDTSLDFEGVTRTVRVPYGSRPGYGFSRVSTGPEDAIGFSLVTEFVSRAQALFVLSLADERTLLRQQLLDPVPAETSFVVSDLAIPGRPPPLQTDDPSQPQAYYSLDEGRVADALQLMVERGGLIWVVSIPAEAQGHFTFPELPGELSSYLLEDPDDYDVLHLDLDAVDGYAAFASEPILDYASDPGLADLTIARSSR